MDTIPLSDMYFAIILYQYGFLDIHVSLNLSLQKVDQFKEKNIMKI